MRRSLQLHASCAIPCFGSHYTLFLLKILCRSAALPVEPSISISLREDTEEGGRRTERPVTLEILGTIIFSIFSRAAWSGTTITKD